MYKNIGKIVTIATVVKKKIWLTLWARVGGTYLKHYIAHKKKKNSARRFKYTYSGLFI